MTDKATGHLLADLGITKTHSRPYQSNDNPYSESQFKTMKYRPEFPDRFGSIQDARAFCRRFFDWYNNRHHHSGIGLLPPKKTGPFRPGRADPPSASDRPRRRPRPSPQPLGPRCTPGPRPCRRRPGSTRPKTRKGRLPKLMRTMSQSR
ncbi:conserved protein of unknown function, containing polynucleotidyl transferase, ribonuclease H fold [Magnetospirillum gryphiswaldense MSR-1 v2]|uniref:Integrase catalytic domain-containing protein n=1 Tax=Magnetospirillum gryphiswaldense (strain DSM 6361 / JCM 21280 / NBRC 15271 / MSR-1) TaxID=431944 RepID=V6EXH2_MAGGM|nr:conserved protein of unknown function, containing polynucleotidyl transferase, ribonuclease H fold [Magnetospirillum gryphiswaldense MSR-1 v2]